MEPSNIEFPHIIFPVGYAKEVQETKYSPHDAIIRYPQNNVNGCFFGGL